MQTVKWIFLLVPALVFSSARPLSVESTQWISLKEAETRLGSEKRPVLIDLYTDWCGWCKVMDKKTYANKQVAAYLAEKFYTVKVDAESKEAISWKGKAYAFNARYKTNDFAIFLTRGQLSYPTTVIIPADGSEPQAIPGFLEPKDFEMIVKYFGEGHYGKTPFPEYQRSFKGSWK
jgi:thioredoxin-related protein